MKKKTNITNVHWSVRKTTKNCIFISLYEVVKGTENIYNVVDSFGNAINSWLVEKWRGERSQLCWNNHTHFTMILLVAFGRSASRCRVLKWGSSTITRAHHHRHLLDGITVVSRVCATYKYTFSTCVRAVYAEMTVRPLIGAEWVKERRERKWGISFARTLATIGLY